jgi:hypothetical protein
LESRSETDSLGDEGADKEEFDEEEQGTDDEEKEFDE